jgi:CBS domain containing-hemolysin-like protein
LTFQKYVDILEIGITIGEFVIMEFTEFTFSNDQLLGLLPVLVATMIIAIINGILLMIDAAFSSVPEDEINHRAKTEPSYARLKEFLKKREKIITSNLFFQEIVPIIGGSQLHRLQNNIVLNHYQSIIVEVVSVLIIIQCASIFKGFGFKYPLEISSISVLPLWVVSIIISPISSAIEKIAHIIVGDLNRDKIIREAVIREDIVSAENIGIFDATEAGFITRAMQFSDNTVASVMTFLGDVFALYADKEYTLDEIIKDFNSAHSRVPIVRFNNLNVESNGYILTKELLLGLLAVGDSLPEKFSIQALIQLVKSSGYSNEINIYQLETVLEHDSITKVWKIFNGQNPASSKFPYSSLALVTHELSGQILGIVSGTDILQELTGSALNDEDDRFDQESSSQMLIPFGA